jgi:membrane protein implicated in regulation of membrane protease activity
VIGWIAALLCIIANILVVKKINGFLIWFIGTGLLLILAAIRHEWSQVFLFTIYEIINVFGYINWKIKKTNRTHNLNL